MPNHGELRWLLRPLADAAFLPLYLKRNAHLDVHFLEHLFYCLPADQERKEGDRPKAWKRLSRWVAGSTSPTDWFVRVLEQLRSDELKDGARELAPFWSLPQLFEDPEQRPSRESIGYYEIHAHYKGSVPFPALWDLWLLEHRPRAELRKIRVSHGKWSRTWADLVEKARSLRAALPKPHRDLRKQNADCKSEHALALVANHLLNGMFAGAERRAAVRYLAICTCLRRLLVHQRSQAGLSGFVGSYEIYSKVQKVRGPGERRVTRTLVVNLLERFEKEGAVSVELRPTLERRPRELQRKLTALVEGYFDYLEKARKNERRPVLFGLVPSLFKQDGLRRGRGPTAWREQQKHWSHQVEALLELLGRSPLLRWFVVGVDAAGKERGCPPRALAAALKKVRRFNSIVSSPGIRPGRAMDLSELLSVTPPGTKAHKAWLRDIPHVRLGVTIHAGEDFEDPITGLRHIWETLHDLKLLPGDRIGHALACGLDKELLDQYLERRAQPSPPSRSEQSKAHSVRKPRGVHLHDLAWEYRMLRERGLHPPSAALARLTEISTRAFGAPPDAAALATMLNRSQEAAHMFLPGVRFSDPKEVAATDYEEVRLDKDWRTRFEKLRGWVLDDLVRHDIVVESCPTSNMAIANLRTAPAEVLLNDKGLRLAIATDDPGILGVWPMEELGRIAPEHRRRVLDQNRSASFVWRDEREPARK